MRKLVAGALAAAALSWAYGATADDAAKRQEAMRQGSRDTASERAGTAQEQAQGQMQRGQAKAEEKRQSLFGGKENYDLKGKIGKVSGDKLTVQRENLPEATLSVTRETKIELNGEKATLSQLKQGEDVKASFNLKGDKPEAIEIKAERK